MKTFMLGLLILALALTTTPVRADVPEKYRPMVAKGLKWLAKQQHKDGYWSAQGGSYPFAITGLAGVAFHLEGSTPREGAYAGNIQRAIGWLLKHSNQENRLDGLLGDPNNPTEAGRYMFGHGYAMLFLAKVYGDIDDRGQRDKVRDALTRAVRFSAAAQTKQGGWFYTSSQEGAEMDEGAVTVVQLHALRAARNAGIPVPRDLLARAHDYLRLSTSERGGVVYSLGRGANRAPVGGERPTITAGALAAVFHGGNAKDPLVRRWFEYAHAVIPLRPDVRLGMDGFLHYYYAQAVYDLGDEGWVKMFPEAKADEALTWTRYRQVWFEHLRTTQKDDGSWANSVNYPIGPVYATAVHLSILQLDNTALPISR